MRLKMYKRMAKAISYNSRKRSKDDIEFIIIHWTEGTCDTAKNECDFFATGNNRQAGAHFFVDRSGLIGRSIPMNRTAWSVGGDQRDGTRGEARYFNVCTNANSVSIELCAINGKDPTQAQIDATRQLIKYIMKYCKNIRTIGRHWDVNGKKCPGSMIGLKNPLWDETLKAIQQ